MSYHTHVNFQFSDEPPIDSVLERARSFLEPPGIYAVDDLLEDLRAGFEEGNCLFNKFVCHNFEELMEHVSAAFPGIIIYVRGMGEEYGDVWLRQFQDGKTQDRPPNRPPLNAPAGNEYNLGADDDSVILLKSGAVPLQAAVSRRGAGRCQILSGDFS